MRNTKTNGTDQKFKHITVSELSHGTKRIIQELNDTNTIAIVQMVAPQTQQSIAIAAVVPYELFMKWQELYHKMLDRIEGATSEIKSIANGNGGNRKVPYGKKSLQDQIDKRIHQIK